jgi:hypothetical protein
LEGFNAPERVAELLQGMVFTDGFPAPDTPPEMQGSPPNQPYHSHTVHQITRLDISPPRDFCDSQYPGLRRGSGLKIADWTQPRTP